MACDLGWHAIAKNVVLACGNHTCGILFNDRPDIWLNYSVVGGKFSQLHSIGFDGSFLSFIRSDLINLIDNVIAALAGAFKCWAAFIAVP